MTTSLQQIVFMRINCNLVTTFLATLSGIKRLQKFCDYNVTEWVQTLMSGVVLVSTLSKSQTMTAVWIVEPVATRLRSAWTDSG